MLDPRLRHRAAYLAPTRFRPEMNGAAALPTEGLLPFDDDDDDITTIPRNDTEDPRNYFAVRCWYDTLALVYESLFNFFVLLLIACMSLFFYDVEISSVKMSNQQHSSNTRQQGARIVWRNEASAYPIATIRRRSFEDTIV
jgi:hypothetical protein